MAQPYVQENFISFQNGAAALSRYRLVKNSSGVLAYNGAGESAFVGTLDEDVDANANATVRLPGTWCVRPVVAAAAVAADAALYATADGTVDDAVGGAPIGRALTAATAAGQVIQALIWLPHPPAAP